MRARKDQMASWLLRLSSILVVLGLLVVSIYFIVSLVLELTTGTAVFRGTHHDFLAFYTGASFTLHGHISDIFNAELVTNFQRQIIDHPVGAAGYMPFLNPPFTAVLLSPLALLPIAKARIAWLLLNAALIGWIAYWLVRPLGKRWRVIGGVMLAASFPVFQAMINGQPTVIILFGCVVAYILAQRHKYVLSGACLSVLWIKPQFAVFAIIGLIIARQWRVIASMLGTITAVLVAFLPITGIALYFTYVRFMLQIIPDHFNGGGTVAPTVWHGALNLSAGLNGLYAALLGQDQVRAVNVLTGLSIISLGTLFILAARKTKLSLSSPDGRLLCVAAITTALLIDPHLYAQDVLLIYLSLPLLAGFKHYFRNLVVLVLLCNMVRVDQVIPVHVATAVAAGLVVMIFIRIIKAPRQARMA